ncbi:M43 family zinc metalloprotease [Hymenobacter sp. AT01-02]|uniref:M43 family zinc metalloprotease n=1 Tax=Hymenobacter sp. AT01-02 TaxID=1571877 RepID=UPI00092FD784|nr:M43 family zinc metalloprotease [Hymenobacter sp. AT01-02]
MKKTFTSLALLAISGMAATVQAQDAQRAKVSNIAFTLDQQVRRRCSTMDVLTEQLASNPGMARRMAAIEEHTRQFEANPTARRTTAALTIPVVVHVLYNTTAQNVSDAQVQAQIDVLNQDFAKTNADASLIPAAFAASAASANIQFTLAKRTPTGTATTGIIHKQTKVSSWSSNDAVKNSKRGGDDAWDASKYLNLWVCNLGQGLLGYAQFPGGSPATDGVVVLYSSLPGGTAKPYDKGRTATHEVGHWLNLRHIWGDASCGNDYVSDTPTQQTSNYGCPSFPHVTCSNGTSGDMFMNYMDYTDDACMYMFSNGQASRMNALFATGGARASLVTSTGGTAPRMIASTSSTDLDVQLYPNPTSGKLILQSSLEEAAGKWSVKVYDLQGFEMKQLRTDDPATLDVGRLPNGLYHAVLTNGTTTVHRRFQKE